MPDTLRHARHSDAACSPIPLFTVPLAFASDLNCLWASFCSLSMRFSNFAGLSATLTTELLILSLGPAFFVSAQQTQAQTLPPWVFETMYWAW